MTAETSRRRRGLGWWLRTGGIALVLLLAAMWVAGRVARTSLMRRYPAPGTLVEVNGRQMHLYCTGEGGPTVILLAGLDDFSITWSLVQPEAARASRVCSYDRMGLGWSEAGPEARTSSNMVAELHDLLRNAGIEPPYILAAHSFGGPLARLYIHDYPEEVIGLVLVDAAPLDLFERVPAWSRALDMKLGMLKTLAPMSSLGLLALAPESVPNRGFPEKALAQYRAVSAATGYWDTAIVESEMFAANLAAVRALNLNDLGDLPLAVLSRGTWAAMPGLSDDENRQAETEWRAMQLEMVTLSDNSTHTIAGASEHFIQLQQPELVIEAIRWALQGAAP